MDTEHQLYQNPAKSPLKPKKVPVIIAEGRTPRYGLEVMKQDLLLTGAAGKDREGKQRQGRQRQRRQTKTEKAKKTDGSVQRYSYLTTAGGQLPYSESAKNTAGRHFGLLQYLSVSSLVEMVYLSAETDSLSESYLFS